MVLICHSTKTNTKATASVPYFLFKKPIKNIRNIILLCIYLMLEVPKLTILFLQAARMNLNSVHLQYLRFYFVR